MPNKNLTDNEIVKALEICSKYTDVRNCENCPLKPNCDVNVLETLSLDLINRQKEEIERLEVEVKSLVEHGIHERYPHIVLCGNGAIFTKSLEEYDKLIADISAEARKEFAERVRKAVYRLLLCAGSVDYSEFDNLLKEMESEKDA